MRTTHIPIASVGAWDMVKHISWFFWTWWKQQAKTVEERIEYFRKWPAPPRWCGWMAEAIWDFEASEEDVEAFDYSKYFEQLAALAYFL